MKSKRPLSFSLLCRFVGHKGSDIESGYHVCSRCGLHEYHCWPEYQKAGLLLRPWWWVKRTTYNAIQNVKWRCQQRRMKSDDVPF